MTPGLWRHKWRPILLFLIVNDFGVEYVGKEYADRLVSILKQYHKVSEDWVCIKYSGIDLKWDYKKRT